MQPQRVHPIAADARLAHEQELVARARSDPDAFGQLYDLYVQPVYRYAYRRLGTHEDAEDVTAQTFYRALERMNGYEWRALPFGAWLFRIAHNLVVDRWRTGTGPLSLDVMRGAGPEGRPTREPADEAQLPPDAGLLAREETDASWAAVAELPPLQRRAVTLRFGRDLSHAQVGVIIGRSEAATKQLIYRAMKTLRGRIEAEG